MTKDDFDHMVYEHQGLIWKICRPFSGDEEDQKDMFQEILLKLWDDFLPCKGSIKYDRYYESDSLLYMDKLSTGLVNCEYT